MYQVSGVGKKDKNVTVKYGKEERVIMPNEHGFWTIDLSTFSEYPKFITFMVNNQTKTMKDRPYGLVIK